MKDRIAVNPYPFRQAVRCRDAHFGSKVLELVREGLPFEQIIRDYYPDLKPEDIKACVQFAIEVLRRKTCHVSVAS